ncbi:MAG: Thymidylate kinase [Candidatus Nomurabacteria bacterium GW2011_GWC2_41_8]|uniref:Thymidylate kinase n=3 Tax=Candidatus Nomuraibacteriota TaxID=1752729 RepID=A0A1F6YAF6_9BACT|nr:MAG: Thymidylate kinase [Candidatus Nomurabacteria bacterium GW2011_GWA2_41_25]KKS24650.1 MAG: Thymidylate kinase [Candidatus Nomurabacteria bacterium GW2011_GWC2_41_8]OGI66758.1 MAG: dTMP kinase [Candidatus Nomurabacteria bacterium RIFCSPHIGHO2_01_FULL_41_91]OGI80950.1 MAG: dTMP kinase [Candidatus Nomurabacteria bacterium RIFCSPHIGHO2_02_FULL_41_52]OGI84521.1 MAG: dTMP kinase [Candidatus Nomurabacteria bacterium RIFCSPHIGHO2_12_FULL_42_19]OGI93893.1 MAG: dTMP kinase [Candidatus Nomurabacte
MAKKGKLIVIDGTDGSGKATQTELLIKHLKKDGHKVKVVDFPDYSSNFFGKFIGHCLSEQYYNFVKVHPKIASVLYAADRFESSAKIKKWLKEGNIIIADRYASANQIHQGGKIANTKKRKNFLKWLAEMEYKVFKIPRPDAVFYLSVPIPIVLKLMRERNKNGDKDEKRNYLGRKKAKKQDVHEKDVKFLENSRKSALWLAKTQKGWIKIECVKNSILETRENIHKKIYEKIKKILK